MFYNTTEQKGIDLQTSKGQSMYQDERILEYFKSRPSDLITPDDVLTAIFKDNTPITSVRRSINTLTKGLFLEKTNTKRTGSYGKPVHCWRLRVINNQPTLF